MINTSTAVLETAMNTPLRLLPAPVIRTDTGLTKRISAELAKAEQIILAARLPEYAAILLARDITPEFLADLEARIAACRMMGVDGLKCRRELKGIVRKRQAAQVRLLKCLREIQAAAKQKFSEENPIRLKVYGVGVELDSNAIAFEGTSHSIISAASGDNLPGITPAKLAAATTAREAFVAVLVERLDALARGIQCTVNRREAMKVFTRRRMKIQFAADSEWPPGVPENEQARSRFFLPLKKHYTG